MLGLVSFSLGQVARLGLRNGPLLATLRIHLGSRADLEGLAWFELD